MAHCSLCPSSRWFHHAITAAERIFEIVDEIPAILDRPDAIAMPRIEGHIKLENVTFGYRSHEPVLKKVSLEIESGEMIGLVGHSGAGKSTLINLVNRFYDVDEGSIYIDGVDAGFAQGDLRRQVEWSCRNRSCLRGQSGEALPMPTWGDQGRGDPCRQIANAHDFIVTFPDGYTRVGEKGQRLSGGERQRIAIARAVFTILGS